MSQLQDTIRCELCGKMCSMQVPASHLRVAHGMTTKEYRALGYPTLSPRRHAQLQAQAAQSLNYPGRERLSGPNHPNYKDGHRSKISGYRYIYRNGRQMYEHRAIMEDMLGRSLKPEEQVHHKDGNRANNDPSNLFLVSPSAHTKITGKRYHACWRRLGAIAIRLLLEQGWELDDISSEFHTTIGTIIKTLARYPDTLTDLAGGSAKRSR